MKQISTFLFFWLGFNGMLYAQCWHSAIGGGRHNYAIMSDGTLWNIDYEGLPANFITPIQVGNDTNWKQLAYSFHPGDFFGYTWNIGLKNDGSLWKWHDFFQPTPLRFGMDSNWSLLSGGLIHCLALKNDGTLWGWGNNMYGQLADSTIHEIDDPIQIGTNNNWENIAAGYGHTMAIKKDGTLWAWGLNNEGQLGDGTNSFKKSPMQIGTDNDWEVIGAGYGHTMAIKKDGTLWAWGLNDEGQLGDGTNTSKNSPKQIGTDNNWKKIALGHKHTLAIKKDGTLWAWGSSLSNGFKLNKYIPSQIDTGKNWTYVFARNAYSIAIKDDASLWAWGYGESLTSGFDYSVEEMIPCVTSNSQNIQTDIEATISIHPIPAVHEIMIDYKNEKLVDAKIFINTINGSLVMVKTVDQFPVRVEIENFHSGLYILTVQCNNGVAYGKFIKK